MDIFNKLQVTLPPEMGDLSFFYGIFAFLLIFIFGSLLLTDLVIPNNLVKLAANIYVIGLGLYILFSIKTDVHNLKNDLKEFYGLEQKIQESKEGWWNEYV